MREYDDMKKEIKNLPTFQSIREKKEHKKFNEGEIQNIIIKTN